jgi:hypothetical protein
LGSEFIICLILFSKNGKKVISLCLNNAISAVKSAIITAGIKAISLHTAHIRDLYKLYAIPHQTINIISCFRLSHKNIGSSFSI